MEEVRRYKQLSTVVGEGLKRPEMVDGEPKLLTRHKDFRGIFGSPSNIDRLSFELCCDPSVWSGPGKGKDKSLVDLKTSRASPWGRSVPGPRPKGDSGNIYVKAEVSSKESYSDSVVDLGMNRPSLLIQSDIVSGGKKDVDGMLENIRPTLVTNPRIEKEAAAGNQFGHWKHIARSSQLREDFSRSKSANGKRHRSVVNDAFNIRSKKPKIDSSKIVSNILSVGRESLARHSK
ncbi:hypothetical protein QYF36_000696 [Acer negundo]|nr:hypothetical protein QYF36_000696 [Acer negundo]